jgi:hypothetical protein
MFQRAQIHNELSVEKIVRRRSLEGKPIATCDEARLTGLRSIPNSLSILPAAFD